MSDYTAADLLVTRHEVLHAVATYFRLGADAIRYVTRVPDGMRAGCTSFDKSAAVFTKSAPLLAMDMAVIYLMPFAEFYRKNDPKGMAGCDWDIRSASDMADNALRIAGKVEDPSAWTFDWTRRAKKQCEQLLDSRMFWAVLNAVELKLDAYPKINGDFVRVVADEALSR